MQNSHLILNIPSPMEKVETSANSFTPVTPISPSPPMFIKKLYQMLQTEPTYLIRWSDDGRSFLIGDADEFTEKIIRKNFKHDKFSSFVRQLHLYGFQKMKRGRKFTRSSKDDISMAQNEFSHSLFRRDRPDLLVEIRRKISDYEGLQQLDSSFSSPGCTQTKIPFIMAERQSKMELELEQMKARMNEYLMEINHLKSVQISQGEMIKNLMFQSQYQMKPLLEPIEMAAPISGLLSDYQFPAINDSSGFYDGSSGSSFM